DIIYGLRWRIRRGKGECAGIYKGACAAGGLPAFLDQHALRGMRVAMAVPYAAVHFGEISGVSMTDNSVASLLMTEKAKHCAQSIAMRVDYNEHYDTARQQTCLYYAMTPENNIT